MKKIIVASILLLGACSARENVANAEKAISQFHAQFNSGQFQQIYAASDPELKKTASEAATLKMFGALRSKLGAYRGGKQSGWRVNHGTRSNTVVQLDSVFEKGKATETFVFVGNADALRLSAYNVNSPVLVTG